MNKNYLGDSVYACVDVDRLVLTTENGGEPSNTIILETEVLTALFDYAKKYNLI